MTFHDLLFSMEFTRDDLRKMPADTEIMAQFDDGAIGHFTAGMLV